MISFIAAFGIDPAQLKDPQGINFTSIDGASAEEFNIGTTAALSLRNGIWKHVFAIQIGQTGVGFITRRMSLHLLGPSALSCMILQASSQAIGEFILGGEASLQANLIMGDTANGGCRSFFIPPGFTLLVDRSGASAGNFMRVKGLFFEFAVPYQRSPEGVRQPTPSKFNELIPLARQP